MSRDMRWRMKATAKGGDETSRLLYLIKRHKVPISRTRKAIKDAKQGTQGESSSAVDFEAHDKQQLLCLHRCGSGSLGAAAK